MQSILNEVKGANVHKISSEYLKKLRSVRLTWTDRQTDGQTFYIINYIKHVWPSVPRSVVGIDIPQAEQGMKTVAMDHFRMHLLYGVGC